MTHCDGSGARVTTDEQEFSRALPSDSFYPSGT
jgi:hypothetical protein